MDYAAAVEESTTHELTNPKDTLLTASGIL